MDRKKFELTDEKKEFLGRTLFRIKALINFGIVKKGELGGFVEKEYNLDHDGDAWVSGNALVYGNAQVSGDAWVYGDARVYGDAQVYGDAWVYGNALVYGNARVSGDAWVYGDAQVSGDARVSGKVKLTAVLCSRFCFEFDWQVALWLKKEKEYEAKVKQRTRKEGT